MSSNMANQFKWPSTTNLGSVINELYPNLNILDSHVIFTEKLDGQNLSRTFDMSLGEFTGFSSRNQTLVVDIINGRSLNDIKNKYDQCIRHLIKKMKINSLVVSKFIVVGEYIPAQDIKNHEVFSNVNLINYKNTIDDWLVFGILLVDSCGNKKHRYLDKELYNMLVSCGFRVPPILFEGVLRDGILSSSNYMNESIEGVVITSINYSNQFNYKFKVGMYDERPERNAYIIKGREFCEKDMIVAKYIEDMYFNTKAVAKKQSVPSLPNFDVSISSEISKRDINPEVLTCDTSKVKPLVKSITEVISTELELTNEYDQKVLFKQVSKRIGGIISVFKATKNKPVY